MTHTDPIADLLTRIRNAYSARKRNLTCPSSRFKQEILKVLKKEGFIEDFLVSTESGFNSLEISLNIDKKIKFIKRISKPGQRIYSAAKDLKKVLSGLGIAVISTSQGLMTVEEAKSKKLGGEIICEIA